MGKTRQSADLVSDNNIFVDIDNDRVGIGTTIPTQSLDVTGGIRLRSGLHDFYSQVGTASSVLISTGAGVSWANVSQVALQGPQGIQGVQGTFGTQGVQGTSGGGGTGTAAAVDLLEVMLFA